MTADDLIAAFFRVVCEELLPHLAPTGLRREIEAMVGLPVEENA